MKPGPKPKTLDALFWPKVDQSDGPDACWPWMASTDAWGYGRLGWKRSNRTAHRVAYELLNGPIPDGRLVRHTCDNPPCVNPAHLLLGTHADNVADQVSRGRTYDRHGESNPYARLTTDAVRQIRSLGPTTQRRVLAERYGVSVSLIYAVLARRLWANV